MSKTNYIRAETFEDFCKNQTELINILNHRMTSVESHMGSIKTDVAWLKKSLWVIIGLMIAMFTTLLSKSLMGA